MPTVFLCALLSAIFAALTAILAKIGLEGVNSNLATTVRVLMLAPLLCGLVFIQGNAGKLWEFTGKNWLFFFLSALATGLSWLFYFYALSRGKAAYVAPIDKSSLAFTIILAVLILHEKLTWQDVVSTLFVLAALGVSLIKPTTWETAIDTTLANLFPNSAPIDGAAPADARVKWPEVPAKGAVYLLVAEAPLLLATVGDLRAALRRRLADTAAEVKSKRIEYGRLCTRIHWREVHSPFAADYWYAHAARVLFPETASALIPWRASWWIAVERTGDFPRFRKTIDLGHDSLAYAGPIRDKHAANRLIETLEDLFDLCRYHNILVQAPHGKACAYKEMGKCPAPCDGTVSLGHYRGQIEAALAFAAGGPATRAAWRGRMESQMKAAAGGLRFEEAARLRQRLTRAAALDTEPFKQLAALEDFSFLALQPGRTRTVLEPWLIHAGVIEPLPPIESQRSKAKDLPAAMQALYERCQSGSPIKNQQSTIENLTDTLALVAHHLFKGENDPGLYLRLSDILAQGPDLLLSAATRLLARKSAAKPLPEIATDTLTPEPVDQPEPSPQQAAGPGMAG